MGIDVTLYLMREGTGIHQVLAEDKLGENGFVQVNLQDNAAFEPEHVCYVRVTEARDAGWAAWLETAFDFGQNKPRTQSSGCVLALRVSTRVFALTFGTGRHGLDPNRVEYDFGLRVAINKVQQDRLRHLVSKTVDLRTREKSTYHHAGGPVGEFAMDLDVEWLRSVAGAVDPSESFSAVAGADSVRVRNFQNTLAELPQLCSELLTAYEQGIPEAFSFVDHVRPVPTRDPVHKLLEDKFSEALDDGDRDAVEVIVDWAVMDQFASARLKGKDETATIDDLSNEKVWPAVDELVGLEDVTAAEIKLEVLDADGEQVVQLRLVDVVQAELDHNGKNYLRLERRWFSVGADYVKGVDRRIKALPTVTTTLALPRWRKSKHADEGAYNEYVAAKKDWLLQDKKFLHPEPGLSVEPCDLLTEDAHFIHVKEGVSSSSLNHLLGQISASAELYARHSKSRTTMRKRYGTKWKGTPLANRKPTFVAAIGRRQVTADLLGRMLVAKINLLDHARRVQALDFNFALAGFEVSA